MMHKEDELFEGSDMDNAESKAEEEFEEATPQTPACVAAVRPEEKKTKRTHPSDISPMLMFGHHKGEAFQNATEADPQYYFWGASQSKPGIFLRSYL